MVYCNFCARANCKTCCQKERLYPKGLRNDDGDRPRGKICKLCEGKFHIKSIFSDYEVKVDNMDKLEREAETRFKKVNYRMNNVACSSNIKYWAMNDDLTAVKTILKQQVAKNALLYYEQKQLAGSA